LKIAVMGAGGIGGCYGGLLAQAGNDVTLIARGIHLAAIKEKGLQLVQPEGDFTVAVAATDDPSQVGPVGLVIFSVKAHQNSKAVPHIG
jgi:2-dehydropantoate 2-reductase